MSAAVQICTCGRAAWELADRTPTAEWPEQPGQVGNLPVFALKLVHKDYDVCGCLRKPWVAGLKESRPGNPATRVNGQMLWELYIGHSIEYVSPVKAERRCRKCQTWE